MEKVEYVIKTIKSMFAKNYNDAKKKFDINIT
jgi:hypothetical protein